MLVLCLSCALVLLVVRTPCGPPAAQSVPVPLREPCAVPSAENTQIRDGLGLPLSDDAQKASARGLGAFTAAPAAHALQDDVATVEWLTRGRSSGRETSGEVRARPVTDVQAALRAYYGCSSDSAWVCPSVSACVNALPSGLLERRKGPDSAGLGGGGNFWRVQTVCGVVGGGQKRLVAERHR